MDGVEAALRELGCQRRRALLGAVALIGAFAAPRARSEPPLTADEVRAIAKDAYIYGYPLLDEYRIMFGFAVYKAGPQYMGPFNTIMNVAHVYTPDNKAFVSPNSDTPYTFVAADLRTEPYVLTVPPVDGKRYYSFQMMDLYTYNFAYIGSRTTGNAGGRYLIAGPGWKGEVSAGIDRVIRADTTLVSLVGRTQLFGPDDLENVKKIQAGYSVQPLSAYLGRPAPEQAPAIGWVKPVLPPHEKTDPDFFNVLSFVLQFCPSPPGETALRERFASIGIVPGQRFDAASLGDEVRTALVAGMADGQSEIDRRRASLGGNTSGLWGTREALKNDYVLRAVGAQVAVGANSAEEAIYQIYEKDANGQPLDAGTNSYSLHFAKGEQPPVHAFWSLTMYDLPGQFLVRNPINRYLINSPMLPDLKHDDDGGLTLYIQHSSPGQALESNWLPAPAEKFMMALRLYWPMPEVVSGTWKPPQVTSAK